MNYRFFLFSLVFLIHPSESAEEINLSNGATISISSGAGQTVQLAASDLAEKLSQITGKDYLIDAADQTGSIHLIVERNDTDRDAYTIKTSAETGLTITGNSELALQHGVWDFLYRIGYRQYFPGKTWEIIPTRKELKVALDTKETPAYVNRRIWYGYGLWEHNRDAYRDWVKKNCMDGAFKLNTGHAYHRLISSQQVEFDAHPEYYALVNGERKIRIHSKLCISNPGVIAAAKNYGIGFFEKNPEADSVSVDPSDGGNWCECKNCAKLGPPNDRALILANAVAEAVVEKFGNNKYTGMYAYNYHSSPPSIPVHPNVIISVATAFIKDGKKVDDIISGWAEKGAVIGIREYYSVSTWDRDLPGASRGSNLEYLAETIPKFHRQGARFLSAESSDNWGCNGLGYWFASRLMWNPAESKTDTTTDFLQNCFGPAEEPMREFYQLINGSNTRARLVYEDLLARMFSHLNEARSLAGGNREILRRIDDLILYTRHAELFDIYRRSSGTARQKAYEEMIRHAYRIRDTFMVHSYALYRDVHNRDKAVKLPDEAFWKIPEPDNPWKNSERYPESEIVDFLNLGLKKHNTVELNFEAREYAEKDLVPARKLLDLPEVSPGIAHTGRGKRSWFTVVEKVPADLKLFVTGGLITHYRDRGNVKIELYKIGGASEAGEEITLVEENSSVPPDGVERTIVFPVREPGIYQIKLDDGSDMTKVTWPEGQGMATKMSLGVDLPKMTGRWSLYFYVPQHTKSIGLYLAAGAGQLLDPDGDVALKLDHPGGEFLPVPVPEGKSGRLWKFSNVAGSVRLLNVPPFLARTLEELVLPSDSFSF
ncbi:MAG: DUF4838 domain-containing protein [Verrucomicrobiales bacterium]|nr:DUF4838 domain-containing protein [Verrucomicrobiales bacterium]